MKGAGLRPKDAKLAAGKFLALIKGRRLSESDFEVLWKKYCRKFKDDKTDDDSDYIELDELTELVKHFRSWNYNDAMIPPQLLAWYKSNLGMTAGIGESKGDEPGRPVMRARATKKAFKEFLWGSRRDLPPTEDEVYHPGEWDGERFTCCLRTHDDDPGCTDVASQGRYCGGLKPGDRVTVGPEWAHFDDPGDPTSTVAADGTRRQPFGSVESATKTHMSVRWDSEPGRVCTYRWGVKDTYEICVIGEGPEDNDWRPLLTGAIPFLRQIANKRLTESEVLQLWNLYDFNVNETWSMSELRFLLEDIREIQFGERHISADVVRRTADRIKRAALVERVKAYDQTRLNRLLPHHARELVYELAGREIPRRSEDEVESICKDIPFSAYGGKRMCRVRDFVNWWLDKTQQQITWHEFRTAYVDQQLFTGGVILLRKFRDQALDDIKIRELWRIYDRDDSGDIDHEEFAIFMQDLHEVVFGSRLVSKADVLGTLALLDEDDSKKIEWDEFRDYYKGMCLPDASTFVELRRPPPDADTLKVDKRVARILRPRRQGIEIDKANEVIEKNLRRRQRRAIERGKLRGEKPEEVSSEQLDQDLVRQAMVRRHYLRQRREYDLGDVNPRNNGDKDGSIRPPGWT